MKKVAIGSDPNASELKEAIKKHLTDLGYVWETMEVMTRSMPT